MKIKTHRRGGRVVIANMRSYQIEQAVKLLTQARNLLRSAKSPKARAYVARALKSAQGALNNRRRFEFKEAH